MRQFNVTVNGVSYQVSVDEVGVSAAPAVTAAPAPVAAPVAAPAAPAAVAAPAAPAAPVAGEKIAAPMPGTILDVKVKVGDTVKKGDILVILEAMKMENEILSPIDATVKQVSVTKGASVGSGDALVVLG